jgi:HopA1 effector protein family
MAASPQPTAELAEPLLAALGQITVALDCRSGSVAGRPIEAASTAEFTHRLSHAIYELLHVGWATQPADPVKASKDDDFEARLLAATPHACVRRTATVLAVGAEHVFVELDGVRVVIPRTADKSAQAGSRLTVRLPSCRPSLSPGYWVADGTRAVSATEAILRLYVHLTTTDAVLTAWAAVLAMLEERGIGYRAKVTSVPALLPRRDALVVYAAGSDLAKMREVGLQIGSAAPVGPEVSVFTEQLGPGVAVAWEPADRRPAMQGLSFGEHRARATAAGLVRHAGSGGDGTAAEAVRLALMEAGIDPARPAWNRRCG